MLREDTRESVVPELLKRRGEGEDEGASQEGERLPPGIQGVVQRHHRLAEGLALREKVGYGNQAGVGRGEDCGGCQRLDEPRGVLQRQKVCQLGEGKAW